MGVIGKVDIDAVFSVCAMAFDTRETLKIISQAKITCSQLKKLIKF